MNAIVSLEGVHRRFGKVKALDGLSLTVREGEVYGFLGRNGAGKTTTLRILMGILSADSGTVSVLGQSGKRLPTQLKQRIGYVSQEQHFYPWMTAQQLGRFVAGFYPTWDETEFRRLLKVLDVPYTRRNVELSGGSRTKLGLALALAPRPALLLLDEPTAGLDPVARREFNDLVATTVRDRGTTAFFSSHLVDEVQQIAHRVAIIQAGSARFEGEVATLRASVRKLTLPTPAPLIEVRGVDSPPPPQAEGATGPAADSGSAPAFGGAAAAASTPPLGGAAASMEAPPVGAAAGENALSLGGAAQSPPSPTAAAAGENAFFLGGAAQSLPSQTAVAAGESALSLGGAAQSPPSPTAAAAGENAPSLGGAAQSAPSLGGAAQSAPSLGGAAESPSAASPAERSDPAALGAADSATAPASAAPARAPSPEGDAPLGGPAAEGASAARAEAQAPTAQAPGARPPDITGVFTLAQSRRPPLDEESDPTPPPPVPHTARAPILYFLKPEPAMTTPPEGFTRLRGDVWRAAPELWESTPWPQGTAVDTLSLEDIFLAFARTDAAP